MALTTRRGPAFGNPSKATRQQVPPFLSKLYHMVNEPETDFLIRWSDDGDSFYVYDHERFAKEVLPHWFKHNNFGSFVRQLNNYGFHKVPHLQQGVLKSDGEAEVSHFENQNFHRGQPDLLCLIQRKKQLQVETDESSEIKEPLFTIQTNGAESDSAHSAHNIKGQVLDINALVNGIQAIKRHQHTISAELKELHQSNQSLWQEAFAARERHKKHHDTITRILKFLAGVFGQNVNGSSTRTQEVPNSSNSDNTSSTAVIRRGSRLMIEGGKKADSKNLEATPTPLNVNDLMEPLDFEGGQANDGERYARIETPGSSIISPAFTATPKLDTKSIAGDSDIITSPGTSTPTIPAINGYPFPPTNHNRLATTSIPQLQSPNDLFAQNLNATALTSTTPPPGDINSTFAAILNNPAQLQRVLAALNAPVPMQMPMAGDIDTETNAKDRAPSSSPLFGDFNPSADCQLSPGATLSLLTGTSGTSGGTGSLSVSPLMDDAATLNALAQSTNQLQKSHKGAAEVEADVDMLHGQIESLIESLGLDSHTTSTLRGGGAEDDIIASSGPPLGSVPSMQLPDTGSDFDFDSFLSFDPGVGSSNATGFSPVLQNGADRIGAFLDEVQSVSNESDVAQTPGSEGLSVSAPQENTAQPEGSRKRKSDVQDLAEEMKASKVPRTSKKG